MPTTPPPEPDRNNDYKLWLWVAGAFIVLIAAWTFLIIMAQENQPAVISIEAP